MKKLTLLLLAFASFSMQSQSKKIAKMIDDIESKVIEWRRDFHQNPELSNREFKTAEKIAKHLKGLGIENIYLGAQNKIEQLDDYMTANDIKSENVLYMGDDIPDYPVMKGIGLPCCPQDAVPEIKSISKYISHKKAGKGAVRDVIEQVLKVQGKWSGFYSAKFD